MRYTVVVTDWGNPKEAIVESARMTLTGVRVMLLQWGAIPFSEVNDAVRDLERLGVIHKRHRRFPDIPYSFDIEEIREKVVDVPDCQYAVAIFDKDRVRVGDWVDMDKKSLTRLLRDVCGASKARCDHLFARDEDSFEEPTYNDKFLLARKKTL